MSRKRRTPEYVDNHERWLVSYADFITLLFAFFVVLYSTSRASVGNYTAMSDSIKDAFDLPKTSFEEAATGDTTRSLLEDTGEPRLSGDEQTMAPARAAADGLDSGDIGAAVTESGTEGPLSNSPDGLDEMSVREVNAIATALEDSMGELVAPDTVGIRRNPAWVEIDIPSEMIFPSGSRVFLNDAIPLLERIAEALTVIPNEVKVEVHTDNQPIRTGLFPSNWELSSAQAVVVAKVLVDMGVEPSRLSATGYAGFRPVEDNGTEDGRAANRRVVLSVRARSEDDAALLRQSLGDG